MITYTYKNSTILFVGINPHYGSLERAVPFSNNKMFWYLLSQAGLIKEKRENLKNDAYLRKFYHERFNQFYHLGFINLVDRPTRDITEINKDEELFGRRRLINILKTEKPKVICFIGKVAYEKFTSLKNINFGWVPDINNSRSFVMHFPLREPASIRIEELKEINYVANLLT